MSPALKIAVAGSDSHMGRAIISAAATDPIFDCLGTIGEPGDAGAGLIGLQHALNNADVLLVFSSSTAAATLARECAKRGGPPLVIGSTGVEQLEVKQFAAAAREIAIVRSGNFSIGLSILTEVVAQISRVLSPEVWDIEIVEAHHRRKIESPSPTALMLGEAAAGGRGVSLASVECRSRNGIIGERPAGEIGLSVVRAGGIGGQHTVLFATSEEVLTLSHSVLDRRMLAQGALTAARWLIGREPGEYSMADVLGLSRKP